MYSWLQRVQWGVFVCFCLCCACHDLSTLTASWQMLEFPQFKWKIYCCFSWEQFCRKCKLRFSYRLTWKRCRGEDIYRKHDRRVCLPLTSPGPAIQGGSCGCYRVQWETGVGVDMLSHPGPSPLSQTCAFYITPAACVGLRYSCGCTRTTLLSTS